MVAPTVEDGKGWVQVKNATGTDAVPIQDGGNSITVDAASLPLPTGASTLAEQQTQGGILDRIPTGSELLTNAHLFDDADANSVPDGWTVGGSVTPSYIAAEHAWQGIAVGAVDLLAQIVTAGRGRYSFGFRAKRTAGTSTVLARLTFFNSSLAVISTVDSLPVASASYGTYNVEGLAPAGTTYVGCTIVLSAAGTWAVKRCGLNRWDGPIETQLPAALGQTTMGASLAVAIASDQSALPATLKPSATATGLLVLRQTALTNTAVAIKASAGRLHGYHLYNVNATTVYVHFYNIAAASVTVGTSTPLVSYALPSTATGTVGLDSMFAIPIEFGTAMSYACSTTSTGGTAPTTAILAQAFYI